MRVGTNSVLYGAHAFWLHPWFVAFGWWKLYGFPWQPWLWVAFFVHDIGYFDKPNMDGAEGETHPWTGARILWWLQGAWLFRQQMFRPVCFPTARAIAWWHVRRQWAGAQLLVSRQDLIWGNEAFYHSRFLAKKYGVTPSRLCMADKLAFCFTPWWLYLPMVITTGEIVEYMALAEQRHAKGEPRYAHVHAGQVFGTSRRRWHAQVAKYMRRYVEEHKDGRVDTWTPDTHEAPARQPVNGTGVWR